MASQEPAEEHGHTETEEGTIAIQKKRARRVSFAENTSVHFFDRDEEFETPPDSTKPSSFSELVKSGEDLGFFPVEPNNESSQNEEEEEYEEFIDGSRSPFLRPMGSPSPGSTFGSATSNDEDNFFGPVVSSFIRPLRLSDSGASDDNHDLTMDSTAFSMHFHSIARSDSEGELKTSTRLQLSFGEKTPSSDSTPSTRGSSMVMTDAKRPNTNNSDYISKLNGGCDSSDMSLVGEYRHRYDYGRLSPELDALLANSSKDLHVVPISNNSNDLEPSPSREMKLSSPKENESLPMYLNHNQNKVCEVTDAGSFVHNEFNQANVGSISPSHQMAFSFSSTTPKVVGLNTSSPHSLTGIPNGKRNKSGNDASQRSDGSSALDPDNLAPQVDDFAAQENHFPLPGSASLFAKRRRILLNNASPSKSQWNVTPSEKQTSSFLRTETIIHDESTSSILKSISKLRMLEASPFSSALNAKIEDSSLRSSDKFFKLTPSSTLLEKNNRAPQVNDTGYNAVESHPPDICSGEQLSAVDQMRRENGRLMNMNDNRIFETPKSIKLAPLSALPSQFTWSGEKMQSKHLTSEDPTKGGLIIASDRATASPQRLLSSSLKRLEMLKSPKYQNSPSRDLSLPIGAVRDADSRHNVVNTNCSIGEADKPDSLFTEGDEPSRPLNIGISTELKEVDNRAITIVQDFGTTWNMANSVKDKESENYISGSANSDLHTDRVLTRFGNELLDGGVKAVSLVSHQTAHKPSFQKNLVDQFCQSPLKNMLNTASPNGYVHDLPEEDARSPVPNLVTKGTVNSSERKRRNEDTKLGNEDHKEEFFGIGRTPELQKGGVSLKCIDGINSGPYINGDKKHMAEISTKFLEDTKDLLSASVDKLNLQAIDKLEDLLCQLQRSKAYEMLCTDIESQKSFDHSSDLLRKREAQTRLLLHKIVHEQAKLQLMCVKRERLQKRIQLVSSGIQESEVLKSSCMPQKCIQVEDGRFKSFTGNHMDIQEASCDEVRARRLLVEESERRIFELTKAFQMSLKMKGEPSPAETINLVNNHLIKRACLRLVRMESQLWVVENLENKNGHHSVVLNYHDLIIQRLTITVNPVSNICISNKLNETNIIKNFADMDACTAFRFVFNAETTRKYVGAPNLAQDTQLSCSLLGNLLDVIQEVLLARIELPNLTHTSFCSQSVEHLYLRLCFFGYKHGKKTTLTLDMTCLKRGVYPSEILPSHAVVPINGSQNPPSQSLLPEISAAAQNLRVGFMRIIRLCRCISNMVNS